MNKKIPYGRQSISDSDIDEVIKVLKSDFLTQGPNIQVFEDKVKSYCDANHAIAVNSATSALHISYLALGVGRGDLVWTSANTFVATSNSALHCGADIDFVDIDPDTYNISISCLEKKLQIAKKEKKLPKVVVPVHMAGQPCDMESIFELSKEYDFKIVEDASHAIGAEYKNEKVGNCKFSSFTVFSFHPVKIITSGEGGMALTNDYELSKKARLYSSHGVTSDPQDMIERPDDEIWNYQQIGLGFNFRLTDIQAALGTNQLKRLDEFVEKRHSLADLYNKRLNEEIFQFPFQENQSYSSYHLYLLKLREEFSCKHKEIFSYLHKKGILVNLHYIPVYRQPFYENLGFEKGYCPFAEDYFKSILSIPLYPDLSPKNQEKVIQTLNSIKDL